jgi:uncharacterized protein (DUF1800 family)
MGAAIVAANNIEQLRGWWLLRMTQTAFPLRARVALYWHNHFATSFAKVQSSAMMLQQLRTFERHGLGRFEDLLLAVARDPAMSVWLDGDQNIVGRPNENFARELFELFALGVGHYTEDDIREAARAFTGWHQRGGRFRFLRLNHDTGRKTVFGEMGHFGGEDIIRLAVRHDACAPFLARKLIREFVHPDPPAKLVDDIADRLRDNGMHIGHTLRDLMKHPSLRDEALARRRVVAPVEFVVGMARSIGLRPAANDMARVTSDMGQRLFEPPSVKGWDGDRAWLNAATMLVRLNTATRAAGHERFDAATMLRRHGLDHTRDAVRFAAQLTLGDALPAGLARALHAGPSDPDAALRRALRLLFSCPEYQLV